MTKDLALLVGESHTSMEFHKVQHRMIRALHEAGRRLLAERGVLDRLREMEQRAAERRVSAASGRALGSPRGRSRRPA